MIEQNIDEANKFKEEGNESFRKDDWESAIRYYTKAIIARNDDSRETATFYKNRAAAYLKQERYNEALNDCDKSLQIVSTDPKTLFRRCQALEKLERYEESYRDARQILNDDPTNKTIQPILQRLFNIVQERARQNAQVTTKIESMTKIALDMEVEREKRETAFNNLLVLSRDRPGAEIMLKNGIISQIKRLLKVEKNHEFYITGVRVVGEICKHDPEFTMAVLKEAGIPWFLEILDSINEKQVNTSHYCLQTILNSFSGMDNKPDTKPNTELCEKYKKEIDVLLSCLMFAINNRAITGLARDSIIELLMKNIHYTTLNWAEQLVEKGGVERLMDVASELDESKYESAMNITSSTRIVAAVCLSRIFENMYYDQARERFMTRIDDFIRDKLLSPDIESKLRVCVAITALLRGPLEVGNAIVGKEGIMEMILVMANSDDELQQKIACECIIAASSKKDKAKAIISQGIEILKKLYICKNDNIRIRALVGLCKLGSSGGTDASYKPFAEGSTLKLAEACRKFLLHPGKDQDIRKWAAEGLSYLTLDAEVKEKLIEDRPALTALIELAKTGDQSVVYGVITTLVNLCNAYEKQEVMPEMIELAKFAKHHIPEEHEFDDPDFITKRLEVLADLGVTAALVNLCKTESTNSKELIARVFNSLCSHADLRGIVVQQGGSKVLLPLSVQGTEKGKRQAAQALSRIAITINPEVAFPGQRALEIIRPLINQLHPDCNALENFEAMMALCNIAQLNEISRQRIINEGGISKIDHYLFEEHLHLRRAATQCVCNLCMSPDVVKIYEGANDRLKMLLALVFEEDLDTCMAASGALAILTTASMKCCEKIFNSQNWLEAFQYMLSYANVEIQYRGVSIIRNVLDSSKELAEKLMGTECMEVLMARLEVSRVEGGDQLKIVTIVEDCLKIAEGYGIIMKKKENGLENVAEVELEDD